MYILTDRWRQVISSIGENPNDSCGISLTTNNNAGGYLSQSLARSEHIVFNICFNITWNFSTGPLLYGRYEIVVNRRSDNNLLTSFITSIVTLFSCSIRISLGIPALLNIPTNASATRSVSMLGNATFSGYLVVLSIIVKIYRDFYQNEAQLVQLPVPIRV